MKHEHIVKLVGKERDTDNYYLIMEYCSGGDLYNYIKKNGCLDEN